MPYLGKSPARGLVGSADIDDNAVTLAKMAHGTANQNISYNASGVPVDVALAASGFASMQVFTSSGTWTKPSGIILVKVYVIGGGGGGAGGNSGPQYGNGGGAGGGAMEVIDVSSVSSVTVTIGALGAGGTAGAGSDGGTSSFGSYCSATGGKGGVFNSHNTLTDGGAGTGGNININGQEGGWADWDQESGTTYQGGPGGNSPFGFGLGGVQGHGSGSNVQCSDANGYGSGGGGGHGSGSNNGGEGGVGIVVVEEFK